MDDKVLLKVENISKSFDGSRVLDNVSFTVAAGEAVALLGANGAGKTTLLRIVTTLLKPVVYLAQLKGMRRREAQVSAEGWFSRLGISAWWNRPVARLSKGMQQKLQFIATVAHNPRLVILDEPFSGFDEENSAMLRREILSLKAAGAAIILSTHNLQAAAELCDKTIRL